LKEAAKKERAVKAYEEVKELAEDERNLKTQDEIDASRNKSEGIMEKIERMLL